MKASRCASVMVIDEDHIGRMGLARCIDTLPGYRVCHDTATAAAAECACLQSPPDLIVFALPSPAAEALGELQRLTHAVPRPPCVALVAHRDLTASEHVFQAGALAVIDRSEAPEHLPLALASVLSGGRYPSPSVTQAILAHVAHPRADAHRGDAALLSPRELEIFIHRAQGRGPKVISERLGISVKTVESHEATMKKKLHLPTTSALIHRAEKWLAEQVMRR